MPVDRQLYDDERKVVNPETAMRIATLCATKGTYLRDIMAREGIESLTTFSLTAVLRRLSRSSRYVGLGYADFYDVRGVLIHDTQHLSPYSRVHMVPVRGTSPLAFEPTAETLCGRLITHGSTFGPEGTRCPRCRQIAIDRGLVIMEDVRFE